MTRLRKLVFSITACLFAAWLIFNFKRLFNGQDGLVRLVLGLLFSILIMFRPKPETEQSQSAPYIPPVLGATGALLHIAGIIFKVHQFQWLGILFILGGCANWALPSNYSKDILRSLFFLYWIHPVPGRIIGALQIFMQKLSVEGSEWLLHCLNVRVWANELILYTGFRMFAVPESCSGMATAVTVLLCGLGTGMLFRFTWRYIIALELAGLIQVLILNIFRISLMVILAPKMPEEWAASFLHDTLGIFLIIIIFLINIEAGFLRAWRHKRQTAPDEKTHMHNTFWRNASRVTKFAVLSTITITIVTGAVYRSRPYHRAMMVVGVIDGLVRTNLELADKASLDTIRILPNDMDLRVERVQVLLRRNKYEAALEEMRQVPRSGKYEWCTILEARCLLGLKQTERAEAIVNSLPQSIASSSAAALLKAELAACRDDTKSVVDNIAMVGSRKFIGRTRALFTYLASREQWKTIAKCYSPVPHLELTPLLIEIRAHITMNQLSTAGELIKQGMQSWPGNSELINFMTTLAIRLPGSEWENIFAKEITSSLEKLDKDQLAEIVDNCFSMYRPDLAWLAYRRLQQIDPVDPSLYLIPAQYANVWFTFRKHYLGIAAGETDKIIDMKSYYAKMKQPVTIEVPLLNEMLKNDTDTIREKYTTLCLSELKKRDARNALSTRMLMMYPSVLAMAGMINEAHAKLDDIEKKHPEKKREALIKRAELYEQQNRWQDVYETTREYSKTTPYEPVSICLLRISALMHMNLVSQALSAANDAVQKFPGNMIAQRVLSIVWSVIGDYEQSLFLLRNDNEFMVSPFAANLFLYTERFEPAKKTQRIAGMPDMKLPANQKQCHILPNAEWAITGYWKPLPSQEIMDKSAKTLEKEASSSVSPFMRDLNLLTSTWYGKNGKGSSSYPEKWAAAGRDNQEKASALYELTMLLASQKKYEDAAKCARMAVDIVPDSPLLWRALISFTQGSSETINMARKACPNDPEIWLADIVAQVRDCRIQDKSELDNRLAAEITEITSKDMFSPGTIIRAGDFMRRNSFAKSPSICARSAMNKAPDLLPGYVLGMRCALDNKDTDWAISSAMGAANIAINPWPFNKFIASMKITLQQTQNDAASAVEKMTTQFPKDEVWAENLGNIYLQQGDPERALTVLSKLISDQTGNIGIRPAILGAVAARRASNLQQAVKILESAYAKNPESRILLNNLVYTLASTPSTIPRALALLPRLIELWPDSFVVMDTAAMVYRNSGQIEKAKQYLSKALSYVETTEARWFKQNPTAFNLDLYLGKKDEILNEGLAGMDRVKISSERDTLIPIARKIQERITAKTQ